MRAPQCEIKFLLNPSSHTASRYSFLKHIAAEMGCALGEFLFSVDPLYGVGSPAQETVEYLTGINFVDPNIP